MMVKYSALTTALWLYISLVRVRNKTFSKKNKMRVSQLALSLYRAKSPSYGLGAKWQGLALFSSICMSKIANPSRQEKPFCLTYTAYTRSYSSNGFLASKALLAKNSTKLNSRGLAVEGLLYTEEKFNEWLAGVIDGDGCFQLSKKGYASLQIVTELRDRRLLYLIKQKYGGAVKLYAGDNHLRYRLHHKAGLLNLIKGVNGLIRNPIRILQLGKICDKYAIDLKNTQPLTYYNG